MPADVVGLKIGSSRLAAARVIPGDEPELLQAASRKMPPGLVRSGEVEDLTALSAALRDFFREAKLPTNRVRLGIGSNRIGIRRLEVEGVEDPANLRDAVVFRAQQALPIPVTEAVLDYHVLAIRDDDEGNAVYDVLVAVVYEDLVQVFADACDEAGITLLGIDLEAMALLRALNPAWREAPEADGTGMVALAIGAERTILAVTDGTTCEFTRVIDWGGATLTRAVAQALDVEEDEAEELKRSAVIGPLADGDKDEVATAIELAISNFLSELVSSLEFYQGLDGSLAIREFVIAGGTAQLTGLPELLSNLLGVPFRVAQAGDALPDNASDDAAQCGPDMVVPIGLGIADER